MDAESNIFPQFLYSKTERSLLWFNMFIDALTIFNCTLNKRIYIILKWFKSFSDFLRFTIYFVCNDIIMYEFLPSLMWLTIREEIFQVFDACIGEYFSHSDDFRVLYLLWKITMILSLKTDLSTFYNFF